MLRVFGFMCFVIYVLLATSNAAQFKLVNCNINRIYW